MTPQERLENLTKSIEETKKHIQSIRRLGDYKLINEWEVWLSAQEFARDKVIQEIAEEKEPMTSLWEVVEHNEQLEQKLEEIVEYLQRGKRRGYKLNFNISEKLKEIDKQIENLLKTKKEKEMKVVTAEDISRIFTEMEEKYGKDKAIGILVGKTQESVRLIDRKSAAQILFEKLQEHQNKEEKDMTQDKDVVMVNNFVATIKAVIEEMKSAEETPFLPMIRDLKLKGVYDLYKDIIPVPLEQYKGIYDFLLTQEPKKEEVKVEKLDSPQVFPYKGFKLIFKKVTYESGEVKYRGQCDLVKFKEETSTFALLVDFFTDYIDKKVILTSKNFNETEPVAIRTITEYEYKGFTLLVRSIPPDTEIRAKRNYVGYCHEIGFCLVSELEKEDIVDSFKVAVDNK